MNTIKKIYYSFSAWTKDKKDDTLKADTIDLYGNTMEDLIEKIKLFNKNLCFECWYSLTFYKWEEIITFGNTDRNIIDCCHFPKIINAHKIEVWGETYEI